MTQRRVWRRRRRRSGLTGGAWADLNAVYAGKNAAGSGDHGADRLGQNLDRVDEIHGACTAAETFNAGWHPKI